MKKLLMLILVLGSFLSYAQDSRVNEIAKIIVDFPEGKELTDEEANLVQEMFEIINEEVEKEVIQEASMLNLTMDKYLESNKSFETVIASLEDIVNNLDKYSKLEKFIISAKAGMRYHFQSSTRFNEDHFGEKYNSYLKRIKELVFQVADFLKQY